MSAIYILPLLSIHNTPAFAISPFARSALNLTLPIFVANLPDAAHSITRAVRWSNFQGPVQQLADPIQSISTRPVTNR